MLVNETYTLYSFEKKMVQLIVWYKKMSNLN